MAKKKHWITPGEACEILGVQHKALSGIVQNYEICRVDNPKGRGYIYRRVEVENVARARDIKPDRIVPAKPNAFKKEAMDTVNKILAKGERVKLTLTGTRGEIRAITKLLEFDKRFTGVEPDFSHKCDEQYWRDLRS